VIEVPVERARGARQARVSRGGAMRIRVQRMETKGTNETAVRRSCNGAVPRVSGCSSYHTVTTVPGTGRFAHLRRDDTMPKHSGWRWLLVMGVSGLVACGNGARPADDSGSGGDAAATDVIRPPNSVYCPFFAGTDGGILRTDGLGHPINQPNADPILCHPDMRPGQPCRAYGNAPGVCVDFEYESSGRFPWFTSNNRMALYCRTPDANPCSEVEVTNGAVPTSDVCEEWGNCVRVPNPLPGRRRFVCFPPVCNE
jgi:hypothetical protein